ncbi:Rrp15p-domain-containing protein [Glomus cerebriforme]|uniref:Rrp15p-domain-containing protein n=1 Tax=Glomus cerebriforme TaxID=658196 RepID=A0A397SX98_9GLOM|nr:Rrp15p-domain-containing protein [Glomus cerebriforme]
MGRVNSNKLKRLETNSIKSKQKKREIERDINHAKNRQNEPVRKENFDMKEIKNIDKQEETLSETVSGNSSIISSDEDSMNYNSIPKMKKPSKNTTSSFAETMNKLLTAPVNQTPVLSRSKGIEREIDEAKLEYKARRAISMEKKKLASKDRVKADLTSIDYERKLRKLATRGVVQLFNAIRKSQKTTDDVIKAVGGEPKLTSRDAEDVANMSKETFLDFLKGGN